MAGDGVEEGIGHGGDGRRRDSCSRPPSVGLFFILLSKYSKPDRLCCEGGSARGEEGAGVAGVRRRGEKPDIPHPIVAIGFGLGVLLALDFNGDEFLCAFL